MRGAILPFGPKAVDAVLQIPRGIQCRSVLLSATSEQIKGTLLFGSVWTCEWTYTHTALARRRPTPLPGNTRNATERRCRQMRARHGELFQVEYVHCLSSAHYDHLGDICIFSYRLSVFGQRDPSQIWLRVPHDVSERRRSDIDDRLRMRCQVT